MFNRYMFRSLAVIVIVALTVPAASIEVLAAPPSGAGALLISHLAVATRHHRADQLH